MHPQVLAESVVSCCPKLGRVDIFGQSMQVHVHMSVCTNSLHALLHLQLLSKKLQHGWYSFCMS